MDFKRPPLRHSHIEIAPLVDVIFLLLLFFILSYNLIDESAVDVVLPDSTNTQPESEKIAIVSIGRDGSLYFNAVETTLDEIPSHLESIRPEGRANVSIRSDREVALQKIMEVADALRKGGCTSFSIITRQRE